MYDKLFDTVSQIVKTYGIAIIDDPKFWHILSDSYSFAPDYSIRDTFKECITRGYVSQIAASYPNRRETIAKIEILSNEAKKNGLKDDVVSAILFSIAVGVGTYNRNDFNNHTSANNSGTKPPQNPRPHKSHFKWYEYLIACGIYLLGMIASIGATIFYSAICMGWWLFFIIIFMGFGQAAFLGCMMNYFENLKEQKFKNFIKSIIAPILFAIVANALLSFGFFSESFRMWFSHHIHCWSCDIPTFLSFILAIFYVFFISLGCIGCIDSDISLANLKKNISKGPFWCSLSFILICYCVIIFGPNVSFHIEKERILSQEIQKSELNDSLKRSRSNIVQNLSFRGIGLGISIDTAKGFISNIKDSVNTEYYIETTASDSDEREITYHYYTYFRDPEKKYQTLTQAYTGEPSSDTWDLKGELIEKDINIDNQQVRLKLFEQEGLVYAIVLLPKYGDYHFHDFQSLKNLYTEKYGNPEIEGDIFRWSYKNGFIAISEDFIIYAPDSFDRLVDRAYKAKQEAAIRQLEKEKFEKRMNDSINAASIREDSIRRIKNHQNAINDI